MVERLRFVSVVTWCASAAEAHAAARAQRSRAYDGWVLQSADATRFVVCCPADAWTLFGEGFVLAPRPTRRQRAATTAAVLAIVAGAR
jgi:hypothetical protein